MAAASTGSAPHRAARAVGRRRSSALRRDCRRAACAGLFRASLLTVSSGAREYHEDCYCDEQVDEEDRAAARDRSLAKCRAE